MTVDSSPPTGPLKLMSCLIFIRHGESVANSERRFTLHDAEPLTAAGEGQARDTAELLSGGYRPVALYASPFRRALDTARIVGERLDLQPTVVPGLEEQDFGRLKGQPYERFYRPDAAVSMEHRWRLRPPGGESLLDVLERVGPLVEGLAGRHAGEEIVIVSHGGVMAAIRGWLQGLEAAPQSTPNAGGYLLRGSEYPFEGPLPLEPHPAAVGNARRSGGV